jgi:hypothetical protein
VVKRLVIHSFPESLPKFGVELMLFMRSTILKFKVLKPEAGLIQAFIEGFVMFSCHRLKSPRQ